MAFKAPNSNRVRDGRHATDERFGNNGAFIVQLKRGQTVYVIASDGGGWEHVSVSRKDRCPTWEEMCQVKAMFWDAEDVVVQFHPRESEYVNNHAFCLHLWRQVDCDFPTPPSIFVGMKDAA